VLNQGKEQSSERNCSIRQGKDGTREKEGGGKEENARRGTKREELGEHFGSEKPSRGRRDRHLLSGGRGGWIKEGRKWGKRLHRRQSGTGAEKVVRNGNGGRKKHNRGRVDQIGAKRPKDSGGERGGGAGFYC